jgi:RNA polymerase sigma factor (sigma-70 family)
MFDCDKIDEIRGRGIYCESEDDKDEVEILMVRNDLRKIFFKEVSRCPRLKTKEVSKIGKMMKKARRKEMRWIEKISQLDFKPWVVSNELGKTLESIKLTRNLKKLHELKDKIVWLIEEHNITKLEEYWLPLEKAKKEANRLSETLIASHLRLVIGLAKKYKYYGLDFLDLIQEGIIGLIKAVQNYEYQAKAKFSTYATPWIKQMIIRALSQQTQMIRCPIYLGDRIKGITKTRSKLRQNWGKEPSLEEIAKEMGLSLEMIEKMSKVHRVQSISLSTPVQGDDSKLEMLIEDKKTENPLKKAMDQDFKEKVNTTLAILTPKERNVIEMRFGMGEGNYDHTLEEIGQKFHFTRERTRQIEEKIFRKLGYTCKHFLEDIL